MQERNTPITTIEKLMPSVSSQVIVAQQVRLASVRKCSVSFISSRLLFGSVTKE